MKNFFKLFGIVILISAIGFSVISCDLSDNDNEMLNGVWDRGDIVITINGDTGVFTQINSNSPWQIVQNNGSVRIGDRKLRNITKSGDLAWTGQYFVYDTSNYRDTWWENCTITLDASGQTLRINTPATINPITTYTKR